MKQYFRTKVIIAYLSPFLIAQFFQFINPSNCSTHKPGICQQCLLEIFYSPRSYNIFWSCTNLSTSARRLLAVYCFYNSLKHYSFKIFNYRLWRIGESMQCKFGGNLTALTTLKTICQFFQTTPLYFSQHLIFCWTEKDGDKLTQWIKFPSFSLHRKHSALRVIFTVNLAWDISSA